MPVDRAEEYWKAITKIEAQDVLMQTKVQSFTHMKRNDQRKFSNQMLKLAYDQREKKGLTFQEFANKIGK